MKIRGDTAWRLCPQMTLRSLMTLTTLKTLLAGKAANTYTHSRHSEARSAEESVCSFRHSEGAIATEESVSQ